MFGVVALALVALVFVVVAPACSNSGNTRGTSAATASREEGGPKPSRPTKSEVACRLHSCAPPFYCNQDTGLCEKLPCAASGSCPYGYKCDFSKNVCQ